MMPRPRVMAMLVHMACAIIGAEWRAHQPEKPRVVYKAAAVGMSM